MFCCSDASCFDLIPPSFDDLCFVMLLRLVLLFTNHHGRACAVYFLHNTMEGYR